VPKCPMEKTAGGMATSSHPAAVCTPLRRLGQGQMQVGRSHLSKRTCAGGVRCVPVGRRVGAGARMGGALRGSAAPAQQTVYNCSDCSTAPRAKMRRRLPVWPPPERVDHVCKTVLPGTVSPRRTLVAEAGQRDLQQHTQMLYHDVCTAMPYRTGTRRSRRCREFDS
jgi:hypothetical protein